MNLNKKQVLVAGGTGMIGQEVIALLLSKGANVIVASNEDKSKLTLDVEHKKVDLREFAQCKEVTKGIDVVFGLVGVKGSPKMAAERPASFFVPMLQFDTNLMEAARLSDVEWMLFTSSVGVYGKFDSPEDDLWNEYPSKSDWYAGFAKRMGELQREAYRIQYGWDKVSVIRPANVMGKYDNFDPETGMVIPSLIAKIESGLEILPVWGDGSAERDIIYAKDVAKICLFLVENEITAPVNAGTGIGISIKKVVETILKFTKNKPKVEWDISKPTGEKRRVLNTKRLESLGFNDFTPFEVAIQEVVEWYNQNKAIVNNRYNPFLKL